MWFLINLKSNSSSFWTVALPASSFPNFDGLNIFSQIQQVPCPDF